MADHATIFIDLLHSKFLHMSPYAAWSLLVGKHQHPTLDSATANKLLKPTIKAYITDIFFNEGLLTGLEVLLIQGKVKNLQFDIWTVLQTKRLTYSLNLTLTLMRPIQQ